MQQKCTLDIAHSGYQLLADGEGTWELSWTCNYGELDDVGYFNGALPPTPTRHFEEIRLADGLFCGKEVNPNPDEPSAPVAHGLKRRVSWLVRLRFRLAPRAGFEPAT